MKKLLILIPRGGLCNRMRAIAGASQLAKIQNKRMIVIWPINRELYSSFNNLFQPIPYYVFSLKSRNYTYRIIMRLIRLFKISKVNEQDVRDYHASGVDFKNLNKDKNFVLDTCHNVTGYADFSLFKINAHIQSLVFQAQELNSMFGIHIRRTDNAMSVNFSPTDLFLQKIEDEIKKDANARFYLATDDPQEEMLIKNRFQGKIIVYPKRSLDRNSTEGIEDALVDLYNLSNCKAIFASYWSSFSDMAAAWKGISKVVLKK